MRTIKLPSELSTAELESLASQASSPISAQDDVFMLFISTFNITPGKHKVHGTVVFQLFKAWSKTLLIHKEFAAKMCKLFVNINGFYLLSNSARKYLYMLLAYTKNSGYIKVDMTTRKKRLERFFKDYNIVPGKLWVPSHVLFYLYDKWRYNRRIKGRIGYNSFTGMLRLYFQHKETNRYGLHFRIDESARNLLNDTELAQLKQGWERTNAKKKKSKKPREISRS